MSLLAFLKQFPDDDACWRHLEAVRWPGGPVCPKCGNVGATSSVGRAHYHGCRGCGSKFTVAFGTALEGRRRRRSRCFNLDCIRSFSPASGSARICLKRSRRFATRYDRRAAYFLAAIQLASSMIWMR